MRTLVAALIGLGASLCGIRPAAAQTYVIPTHVIAGGGATSSNGGAYTLGGTIGQADAFNSSTGGPYAVAGGFWATLVSPGLAFTDDPLTAGVTPVKQVHVTEMRTRIDTLRIHFGLAAAIWTDSTLIAGVTIVKAQHIQELRQALIEAYNAAALTPPTFAEPLQSGVTPIRVAHIAEVRLAIQTLEAF